MKVVFPYIAQTHQIPHSLPIAAELAMQRPDWDVRLVCSSDAQERVARRLVALYPQARLPVERFRPNAFIAWLQKRLGSGIPEKSLTLIRNRRLFADLPGVVPDGICLDAEGAVWVGHARAPQCLVARSARRCCAAGSVVARLVSGALHRRGGFREKWFHE